MNENTFFSGGETLSFRLNVAGYRAKCFFLLCTELSPEVVQLISLRNHRKVIWILNKTVSDVRSILALTPLRCKILHNKEKEIFSLSDIKSY